jgi:ribosomal protein S12 methylthiotransferase accessory factor
VKLDILQEVRRIDNGRLDIPVYFSVCGKDARAVIGNKKQMGKGSSPEQSQASACMELAERFSFFSFKQDEANFITDTYANLKKSGQPLLPLVRLLLSVHDENTDIATLERLIEDIPIQWTWATNLGSGEVLLVPFSWFYAINEFNGPSAGNTFEEAILQGISELVERHVCSLVNHHHLPTPAIDPASVTDPVARELIDKFSKNNIELYLNDFTLDTGIPTVAALAIDRSTFPGQQRDRLHRGHHAGPGKGLDPGDHRGGPAGRGLQLPGQLRGQRAAQAPVHGRGALSHRGGGGHLHPRYAAIERQQHAGGNRPLPGGPLPPRP